MLIKVGIRRIVVNASRWETYTMTSSTTRISTMMFELETYKMDPRNTVTKHPMVMSAIISNQLITVLLLTSIFLLPSDHYIILVSLKASFHA